MGRVIILLLLVVTFGFSQEEKRVSDYITLTDAYTIDNYEVPKSILFFSGGHWEFEKFYNLLYKPLKRKSKKIETKVSFEFDENANILLELTSFDQLKLDFKKKNHEAICVFWIASKGFGEDNYDSEIFIIKFDFYMIMIEPKTNKILMKRKYSVRARNKFYNENRRLAKEVIETIKN
jgi:hypothetical protein